MKQPSRAYLISTLSPNYRKLVRIKTERHITQVLNNMLLWACIAGLVLGYLPCISDNDMHYLSSTQLPLSLNIFKWDFVYFHFSLYIQFSIKYFQISVLKLRTRESVQEMFPAFILTKAASGVCCSRTEAVEATPTTSSPRTAALPPAGVPVELSYTPYSSMVSPMSRDRNPFEMVVKLD